ncbi:SBBP repeat-containing protein [Chloroflexota bacterium]
MKIGMRLVICLLILLPSLSLDSSQSNAASSSANPVLAWNTFMGADSQDDSAPGLAVDNWGNILVAGDSMATWGSPVRPFTDDIDAFVAKFDPNGVRLWNTFLGCASTDRGLAVAAGSGGAVYVTGYSEGSWGNPVNPYTNADIFIAKLDSNGNLLWNTFVGGSGGFDMAVSIVLDGMDNIYIAGTASTNWGTPRNPYSGGFSDGFAAKVSSSGVLQWHIFLGSPETDEAQEIVLDGGGNLYILGYSNCPWGSPLIGWQGSWDAFLVKLDNDGYPVWLTFMGGVSEDKAFGMAVDGAGNIYVTGHSWATWGPPINAFIEGGSNAFVAKFGYTGFRYWNTFMGGVAMVYGSGIVLDSTGRIFVAGHSLGGWGNPIYPYAGNFDIYVAGLAASGQYAWHTFLGSSDADYAVEIRLDTQANMYVSGNSRATWGAPIVDYGGVVNTLEGCLFKLAPYAIFLPLVIQ